MEPVELEPASHDDRINTSFTYGFVFDMCRVEIDPVTYQVRVDRYVSMHDAGRILNATIAEGKVRGAFAQGIAAALYEEFSYNEEGAFLSGTFADYLVPTVSEIPAVEILHYESPSPSRRSAPRGSPRAIACPRPSASPTPSPTPSASSSGACRRRRGVSCDA